MYGSVKATNDGNALRVGWKMKSGKALSGELALSFVCLVLVAAGSYLVRPKFPIAGSDQLADGTAFLFEHLNLGFKY
jgi:hypothetical protein